MPSKIITKIPKQPIDTGLIDLEDVYRRRELLTLRGYQSEHLGFHLSQNRTCNLSEAGTGKTPIMCLWLYAFARDGGQVVWTMPKSLLAKNYEELLLWSNFEPHEITLVDGTKEQREKQFLRKTTKVFLMGYDAFANNWQRLRELHPKLQHLCVDEFHKGFGNHGEVDFRNPNRIFGTRRTFEMYQFLRRGGGFLPATGTVLNGKLSTAFPILHMIEPRYYGTYNHFMQWHAIVDAYGNPAIWKNHDRLKQLLLKHGRRITFEDAYGKEEKVILTIPCLLSDSQRKHYKQMEQRAITELEDGDILEAKNKAVAIRRCLEIMQIPEELGLKEGPEGKLEQLKSMLEDAKETGEPILIFETLKKAQYKWQKLAVELGLSAAVMNGDVTGEKRQWMDKDFRDGKIQVLVCSPDVAGVGFNWQHVDTIIFMTLDWQDTTFIQNYRRAMRGIREKLLRIYVFMYRQSIDIRIANKINAKSQDRTQVERGVEINITLGS